MIDITDVQITLTESLEAAARRAHSAFDAAPVVAEMDLAVKERTKRGEYLPGSAPDASRYRSSSHKKRREKKGLPIDRVTLFVTGDMLAGTRDEITRGDDLTIRYGYLRGISPEGAVTLAEYHGITGAGKGGPIRRLVGLTDAEETGIGSRFAREYGDELGRQMNGS